MSEAADQITQRGEHLAAEPVLREVPDAILLPYQQAWIADTRPVKVYEKSRRIGISWAEAGDCALHAASQSGSDVFYLAYNLDMTRQFIEDCAWWANWYGLAAGQIKEGEITEETDGVTKTIKVFEIIFESGHRIQALSSKPRNLRSKQGRVVFDEFAFHDDPDELLKAALALLIWGGEVRIISTHNGVDNAFNRLVDDSRAGRRPFSVHRTTFAQAIEAGLYRRICLMKGWTYTEEAEAEWEAQIRAQYGEGGSEELDVVPSKSGGKYFSRVLVEVAMDGGGPVVRLALDDAFAQLPERRRVREIEVWCEEHLGPLLAELDPNLKSGLGEDFGRSSDLTFILPFQLTPQLVRRCPFGVELRNVPFSSQQQIVFWLIDRLPRFIAGAFDARGNGAALAEAAMQRYGATRIHEVQATAAWYLENFPRYRGGISDGSVILPRDVDLLDDHGDVELVNGVPKVPNNVRRKGTDKLPRHADGAVAAVMMWFASMHPGAPIEYDSLPSTSTAAVRRDFLGQGLQRGVEVTEDAFGTLPSATDLRGFQ
ncbi:MAG: terminase family protein [Myxococcota bacterium]